MKTHFIYNPQKKEIVTYIDTINRYLKKKSIEVVSKEDIENCDFVIVIGGDGTLIRASKEIQNMEIPLLAINMGSLGFLTEVKTNEAFPVLDSIISGKAKFEKRYMIRCRLNNKEIYALNEILITKTGSLARMINLEVFADKDYLNTYKSDGVIISTPTGSTAYSLSAGGPILNPNLNAMVLTPIAPHTLTARSIVLSGETNLIIKPINSNPEVCLISDGQQSEELMGNENIEITLSERYIKLVKPANRSYYAVLREKLQWSNRLC